MPASIVENLLKAALMECCPPPVVEKVLVNVCFNTAIEAAEEDLETFAKKDPASRGSVVEIALGYSSYKAVAHYRLANALVAMAAADPANNRDIESCISLISSRGKLVSGAEVHPRCHIGKRFVLDHGWGTVIGETTSIGDDCYVLGGVTLGATGISGNPTGKRHPTLGNRVEIGALTRIFGAVNIGDDVFVGPNCVITHDIPAGAVVTLKTQLQVTRMQRNEASSDHSITFS
jgi:serine O-acetyltransferase